MAEAILPGSVSGGSGGSGPWKQIGTYTNTTSNLQITAMSDVWSYFYNNQYSFIKIEFDIAKSFESGIYYACMVFNNESGGEKVFFTKLCESNPLAADTYIPFPCVMLNSIKDRSFYYLAISVQSSYNPWYFDHQSYMNGTTSLSFSLGNSGASTAIISSSPRVLTVNIYGL